MAKKVSRTAEKVVDSVQESGLYPHLKITNEVFPRLLATRKVLSEKDEYFGAFLPVTSLRIWLYHLNRIFRLRSCDLELDGSFPQPCALYFTKKCLAPCVAGLCDRERYLEHVEALRLFLSGDYPAFAKLIKSRIDALAENLEFEKAAHWRDILDGAKALATKKRLDIRLDNAVDTYSVIETADSLVVYLVTSRGRRLVGSKEFLFERSPENTPESVIERVLKGFYRFYVPRELRLPFPHKDSAGLRRSFFERMGKDAKISVHYDELNEAAEDRLKRTVIEFELEKLGEQMTPGDMAAELKRIFGLRRAPNRIEAFDVAHISNIDFVAASCVWEAGEIRPDQMRFRVVEATGEPQAMALGVLDRLLLPPAPDLLVIDGSKGQLNAVIEALRSVQADIPVIAAAKPAGKHKDIAYFLKPEGERIAFEPGTRAHELLRDLRDEAHQNANSLHRQHRENKYIFEDVSVARVVNETERKALVETFGSLKAAAGTSVDQLTAVVGTLKAREILTAAESPQVLPLVVTRLNELGGAAGDIRPINARLDR